MIMQEHVLYTLHKLSSVRSLFRLAFILPFWKGTVKFYTLMLTFVSFRDSSDEEQASLEETAVTSPQPGQSIGEKRGKERKGITIRCPE